MRMRHKGITLGPVVPTKVRRRPRPQTVADYIGNDAPIPWRPKGVGDLGGDLRGRHREYEIRGEHRMSRTLMGTAFYKTIPTTEYQQAHTM